MNKSESKYYNTAVRMDEALIALLEKKDFAYITVKEICEKAGVNRSTFYLHYETMQDLLSECVAYISRKFSEYFPSNESAMSERLRDCPLEELVFVTPEYLRPYLEFVRQNQVLFRVAVEQPGTLKAEERFQRLFRGTISPVMERFGYTNEERDYIVSFYIHGILAIIMQWLKNGCRESIEKVIQIINACIFPSGNGVVDTAEIARSVRSGEV